MYTGVPQSILLGPLLYTIYTLDIPLVDNITLTTYADDIGIIAADENHIKCRDITMLSVKSSKTHSQCSLVCNQ